MRILFLLASLIGFGFANYFEATNITPYTIEDVDVYVYAQENALSQGYKIHKYTGQINPSETVNLDVTSNCAQIGDVHSNVLSLDGTYTRQTFIPCLYVADCTHSVNIQIAKLINRSGEKVTFRLKSTVDGDDKFFNYLECENNDEVLMYYINTPLQLQMLDSANNLYYVVDAFGTNQMSVKVEPYADIDNAFITSTCNTLTCFTTSVPPQYTSSPTQAPTNSPTQSPTKAPTNSPTQSPTKAPTKAPTRSPTKAPTLPGKMPIFRNAID